MSTMSNDEDQNVPQTQTWMDYINMHKWKILLVILLIAGGIYYMRRNGIELPDTSSVEMGSSLPTKLTITRLKNNVF